MALDLASAWLQLCTAWQVLKDWPLCDRHQWLWVAIKIICQHLAVQQVKALFKYVSRRAVAMQKRTLLAMDGQRRPRRMDLLYPGNPQEPHGVA